MWACPCICLPVSTMARWRWMCQRGTFFPHLAAEMRLHRNTLNETNGWNTKRVEIPAACLILSLWHAPVTKGTLGICFLPLLYRGGGALSAWHCHFTEVSRVPVHQEGQVENAPIMPLCPMRPSEGKILKLETLQRGSIFMVPRRFILDSQRRGRRKTEKTGRG